MKKKKTRNKFERKIELQLKRKKVRFSYETEKIPYVIAGHYIPDFIIVGETGKIYVETKGYLRPEHKRKMIAVKKLNPNLDIRIVFYANKAKDIKWATKAGFRYAVGSIPTEWFQELCISTKTNITSARPRPIPEPSSISL